MPLKPGGGNLPQQYDPDDGRYTDEQKSSMLKNDMKLLEKIKSKKFSMFDRLPHFPTYKIHNDEYNKLFIELHRHKFTDAYIYYSKMNYLFKYDYSKDKSSILIKWGYSSMRPKELANDIMQNTIFKAIKYNRMNISKDKKHGYLMVMGLTTLKGHKTTSIWEAHPNYTLTFATLIPNGDKYEK